MDVVLDVLGTAEITVAVDDTETVWEIARGAGEEF